MSPNIDSKSDNEPAGPAFFRFIEHSLKNVFPDGENQFNNWLFNNIEVLNEIFSVDLDPIQREATIDRLRLDLLLSFSSTDEDGSREHTAVIECQLGSSDNKHLGQLITYGAQHNATYCIWIAESFKPGHIKALNILNETGTENDRYYFPVKVNIVSIGDSKKKVMKFSFDSIEYQQPLSGRSITETNSKGDLYWQFYEIIRVELANQIWFGRGTSTKDSYYEFASRVKSEFVYPTYGWRFNREGKFQAYIAVRRKNKDVTTTNKSKEFTQNLFDQIKKNITYDNDISVKLEDLDLRITPEIGYNLIMLNYPKPNANLDEHLDKLTNWGIKAMIDMYKIAQPEMVKIASTL